jgi:CRP-like cAMP-binding protein
MLRLVSISARLREWEITINWDINLLWIRGARLGLTLVLWMNTAACIYGLIADVENLANGWIGDAPSDQVLLDRNDPFLLYQASLYFAVITFTTIGYGDYTPTTVGERTFTFFYIFCNIWILTVTVGTVTSWLQQAEKARTVLADKLDEVKQYCRFRGIPNDLSAEMMRFFRFKASVKGYEGTDFDALSEVPPGLRGEVAEYMRHTILSYWGLPRVCDSKFLTAVVLRLKRERRSQGEYLTLQGTTARKFFILTQGKAVLTKDGIDIMELSQPGGCFGELALFSDSLRRTATVRAASTCDLLSLSREDMIELLELFPKHSVRINEYAARFEDTFEGRNPDLYAARSKFQRRLDHRRSASNTPIDDNGLEEEPNILEMDNVAQAARSLELPDFTVEDVSGAYFAALVLRRVAVAANRSSRQNRFTSIRGKFRGSSVPLDSSSSEVLRKSAGLRKTHDARLQTGDEKRGGAGTNLTMDDEESSDDEPSQRSGNLRRTEPAVGSSQKQEL